MADRLYIKCSDMKNYMHWNNNDTKLATQAICAKKWPGTNAGKYYILECVSFPWFLCRNTAGSAEIPHADELILHADRILELKDQDRAAKDKA